ncbi:hypothetical protein AB0H69_07410 [Streptomyces phaeochromogenes]|uniref:hypothetical protein n=1 Tax=Streptomyces phaeochromogenes TaxID=1923 RepID=UPI0033E32081
MRHTTTALLTVAVLALAGCSGSSKSDEPEKPAATVTASKSPKVSAEEARAGCVDAWAALLQENADADIDQAPAECDGVGEGEQLDAYMDGLQERNQANRDEIAECVEDPACTSVPIP